MDFLNQASGQLRDLMLSMTPAARLTALLLLGVIGVSMGYLVQHETGGADIDLFNGKVMSGDEIMRANAAIALKGLEGHQIVGNSIKVPAGRQSEFLGAVASGGALPPDFHQIMDDALSLGPFASGATQRGKTKAATEQRLSLIVSSMAGVEHAKVMYDIKSAKGLGRKGTATATVLVRPAAGETFGPREEKMVRIAVAGGLAELSADQVIVTNSEGFSFGSGGSDISAADFDNHPYYTKLLAYEKLMTGKITSQLRHIQGIQVGVTASLGNTIEKTTQTLTPEGEVVALRTDTDNTVDETSEHASNGRPGPIAQGPRSNNKDNPYVTVKNVHTQDIKQAQSTTGQKSEFVSQAGLMPEEVRVAISVPTEYVLKVWKEKQGKDAGEIASDDPEFKALQDNITEDIKNSVSQLIPGEKAVQKGERISVVFSATITPDAVEDPSTATQALAWASQNFNTMTMAGVALIGLMMLRSMVKSVPASEPAVALGPSLALDTVDSGEASGTGGAEGESEGEGERPRLKLKKGESLKDDLIDIVREDPDAAAAILRSWIGNAG